MIVYYDNGARPLMRKEFVASGVPFATLYHRGLPGKAARYLRRGHMPGLLYMNSELQHVQDQPVIIFDAYVSLAELAWIKRRNPDARIILWYWNPVCRSLDPSKVPEGIECWSYSPEDCKRYGLRHNTQFLFDSVAHDPDLRSIPQRHEAVFIGREKGRLGRVLAAKRLVEEAGMPCHLYISKSKTSPPYDGYVPLLPYRKTLLLSCGAEVLVDIYESAVTGMSLRAMESIFFGKKYLTDNPDVRLQAWYDPHNVFVLDDQEDRSFESFLAEPIVPVPEEILSRHLLTNWYARFQEA